MKPEQPELERHFLDRVLSLLDITEVEIEKSETPDFVIKWNSKVIGVELTELHNSKSKTDLYPPSVRQGTIKRIVRKAEKLFFESSSIILNVNINFQQNLKITSNRSKKISQEIAEQVLGQMNFDLGSPKTMILEHELPTEVTFMRIAYWPKVQTSIWYSAEGAWLGDIQEEELNKIIGKKNQTLKNYPKNLNDKWLIIVEGRVPYSWYAGIGNILERSYNSEYGNIYLYRSQIEQIYQLK